MKLYVILTIFLTLCVALSPFTVLSGKKNNDKTETTESVSLTEETKNEPSSEPTVPETLNILRTSSGKIVEKSVFDYVKGAVSAEISPTYEGEAIKAQAVVCLTYALWLKENSEKANLESADISDNPDRFQSYLDENELKEKWGEKYDEYSKKISDCISQVANEYLTFENKPIMACYHAISSGKTESAKNVFGTDVPYLKSVEANGDLLSPEIDSTVTLSAEKFKECAEKINGVKLQNEPSKWLGKSSKTDTGFVKTIVIGSKKLSGNDVRSAFSLRSPAFTVEFKENEFVFHVKGYGHLVGMSQYSADYMARQGATYKEILSHFYPGTTLKKAS